ncbi:glycosyltransferase [Allorhizocola rhizosphaerae]|uniref:glycosyltransferase n=1 Tax=Allorhizocola rhizosphaerae TaxID=1872709 RepID=UPI000E3E56B2|nr:glycosyltransferase [Allorhizocola rhizosphaerae]
MTTKTRIAISVALQNTGQATRALEIAKGLQECTPTGHEVAITFLSHGSWFEPYVREAGFDIMRVQPQVEGRSTDEDMRFDPPELIGSVEWAKAFINGQRQAMQELQPDVVIHSFWQVGSIAAQLEGIPTISFLPVPPSVVVADLHKSRLGLVEQHNLTQAIIDSGWSGEPPTNIYDQIRADMTIINDLPSFYTGIPIPKDVWITGPLFAQGNYGMPMDARLVEMLTADDDRPTILLTMGSSGTRQALLEATNAIAAGAAQHWNAIILASPAIVRLAEVKQIVQDHPSIYVTDEFVPCMPICELADVVVCHGGQATIQTALACGTPIVGVPMQMEQQINLDHVAATGAGIIVPSDRWRTSTIQEAIRTVTGDPTYRLRAQEISHTIHSGYGKRQAAECIWQWIEQGLAVPTAMAGIEFPL